MNIYVAGSYVRAIYLNNNVIWGDVSHQDENTTTKL